MAQDADQQACPAGESPDRSAQRGGAAALVFALALGLAGVAFICFFTHWYEIRIFEGSAPQLIVNALAPVVFFLAFVLVVAVNPLIAALAPALTLRRRELVIVLSMWLVTSAVTYRHLANPVLGTIGMAFNSALDKPQTKRSDLRKLYLRPDLFLDEKAARTFYDGLGARLAWIWPFKPSPRLRPDDLALLPDLAEELLRGRRPVSLFARSRLSPAATAAAEQYLAAHAALRDGLLAGLRRVVQGPNLYRKDLFEGVPLTSATLALVSSGAQGQDLARLNRTLIESAFPAVFAARGAAGPADFQPKDLKDAEQFAALLREGDTPLARRLRDLCLDGNAAFLAAHERAAAGLKKALVRDLNVLVEGGSLYEQARFADVELPQDIRDRLAADRDTPALNRDLLAAAFPRQVLRASPSVPWDDWLRPMLFWTPFMVAVFVMVSALMQMVHRQWSQHELLTYPIADFAGSLLAQAPGRVLPSLFRDRVFWAGFAFIGFIYLVNGLRLWFPLMIEVPLSYDHRELIREFSFLSKYGGTEAYSLFRGMLYPFMACIAVLLPTEISFTCWFGWVLMILGTGAVFLTTGHVIGPTETRFIQVGAYLAMLAMIAYIGRREYLAILRHAVTFRRAEDPLLRRAAAACRVFVLAFAALAALLVHAGMDAFSAVALVASFSLVMVLLARMTAELGIPWLVSFSGMARALPMKLLGAAALGPKSLAVLAVVGAVLDCETQNSVAAQETTYRKLEEQTGAGLSRAGFNAALFAAAAAALAATVFITLWTDYSFGGRLEKRHVSLMTTAMNDAAGEIGRLDIEKSLQAARDADFWQKLRLIKPEPGFLGFSLAGAAVVVGCSLMRLRFTWWPLHPLPFLLFNTWCLGRMYTSFFVGWAVKVALLRVGGGKVFTRSKPFFIGVILGQVVMAGLWIAVSAVCFAATGSRPKAVMFFY